MTKRKRYCAPRQTPGKVKVGYARLERDDDPALIYVYGDNLGRAVTRVLMDGLERKRLRYTFPSLKIDEGPSVVEELEALGYDISTLRLTISKKEP